MLVPRTDHRPGRSGPPRQPSRSRHLTRLVSCGCAERLPELGSGRCLSQLSVFIGIQAARQGRLQVRAGEQVSAIGEDRRRTGHPEPPRVILRGHDPPYHLDIGPDREQWSQPTAQGPGTRAFRHVQDLKPHRIPLPSPAGGGRAAAAGSQHLDRDKRTRALSPLLIRVDHCQQLVHLHPRGGRMAPAARRRTRRRRFTVRATRNGGVTGPPLGEDTSGPGSGA
jgi:hypothetical protein